MAKSLWQTAAGVDPDQDLPRPWYRLLAFFDGYLAVLLLATTTFIAHLPLLNDQRQENMKQSSPAHIRDRDILPAVCICVQKV